MCGVTSAYLVSTSPGYKVVRLKTYRSLNIALSADSARPSRGAARKYMPHNKCWRSAHRLLAGCPHPLDVSLFYVLQFWCVIGLNILTSGSIKLPEAFCAGTTAAYRKGNGSNSALSPSTTLHPPITPALVDHPCTRFGPQASTRATAPTSATARTGPTCRRMPRRLSCIAPSGSL